MKTGKKRHKTNWNRIGMCVLVIIGLTIGISILLGNKETLSYKETSYKTIYVSDGETLWEIANRELNNNDYYIHEDIRNVVSHIRHVNNLKTSTLYIGQEIVIPTL